MPKKVPCTCAQCGVPFVGQYRRGKPQKYCSKECFGKAFTFRSLKTNPRKRQLFEILFEEGLIEREVLRKQLGYTPRHFGRILHRILRVKDTPLFSYQIGLTARGKALLTEFFTEHADG